MFFGFPILIGLAARLYGASFRASLITFAALTVLAPFAYLRARKLSLQACELVASIAQKPGADLSSNAPDSPPPKVLACEESLRTNPPLVRFGRSSLSPLWTWILRIFPLPLIFLAVHPLFDIGYRFPAWPGPGIYITQSVLAFALWFFLLWVTSPTPAPPARALRGAVSMARVCQTTGGISYEFRDLNDVSVRASRRSNLASLYVGTYVPVFYHSADPQTCFAAFDLAYEAANAASSSEPSPIRPR